MSETLLKITNKQISIAAVSLLFISIIAAILANDVLFCLAPIAFLLGYQLLIDFRPIFFLLLLVTPLSIEFTFSGGFGTDLPTEPLEILLSLTFIFYLLLRKENRDKEFTNHPITILLAIHFLWICVATIYSQNIAISFKYLLAKSWYILTFYFLASYVFKSPKQFLTAVWCLFIPALLIVIYTLNNHYRYNFAFSEVNKTMFPYFRNHVNYAVFLALLFPYLVYAQTQYTKYSSQKMLLRFGIIIFLLGIYFSYTRSSWLSITAAAGCFFLIRKNWMRQITILAVAAVIFFVVYMLHDNRYLKYAPDYKKTIYHSNFDDHMESTLTLEDVSSAERIYRWMAATQMIADKPVVGFGPAQFYDNYKEYTINKFETYISNNEEHSTVHNYFLQITVEQGFVGIVIWITFLVTIIFYGQIIYNRAIDAHDKNLVLAVLLSFITILVNITLSDLIEADKIGTLFFMNCSLLVSMDLYVRRKSASKKMPPDLSGK